MGRRLPGAGRSGSSRRLGRGTGQGRWSRAMWNILTSQNRYAITYRIGQVKRPETRAKRLAEFLAMLARGETIHRQNRSLN